MACHMPGGLARHMSAGPMLLPFPNNANMAVQVEKCNRIENQPGLLEEELSEEEKASSSLRIRFSSFLTASLFFRRLEIFFSLKRRSIVTANRNTYAPNSTK